MKINQYACISLSEDYHKKGDNPECKDQWILLNKAQCIQHKLLEYEPIVGPGKFDATNTQNAFTLQTPHSSYLFTTIQDKLVVAYKNKLLQYDFIPDLLSAEKYSSCTPQQQYTVAQGDVISLHSTNSLLIVRTDKAIVFYRSNNQNFTSSKVYNYQGVKQLNIQDNILFLCLSDKLVIINLIDLTEQILKQDNKIIAGFWSQREYYYICEGSNTIKSASKQFQIEKPQDIVVKTIFVIENHICVCGYEMKFEPSEEDDDEPATYGAHIYWFDIKCNQPIKEAAHIEVDLFADTNNRGDFGIIGVGDLQVVYGSNLRKVTFWKLGNIVQEARKFQNSDISEDNLVLLQHSDIRGLTCHLVNPFIGLGMNQRTFRCIARNPSILILNKKGEISTYEFLDFNKLIDFQQPNNINTSTLMSSQKLLTQSKVFGTQQQQNVYKDIKFTVIESLQNELNKLANPPYNLALQLKNNKSSFVMGEGPIDYQFRLHQDQIPSANLVAEFQNYQILGHEREILILTHLDIQNILLNQPHSFRRHEITKNPMELIQGVYRFQNQILIQTNLSLYFTNKIENEWESRKVLTLESIQRVSVRDRYVIIQSYNQENRTMIYEYANNGLQLIAQNQSDAGCYFQLNDQVGLLHLQDGQLYFVKDFTTRQLVSIDIQIDVSQEYEYYITQLHNNHIYIAFGKYDTDTFKQCILNYDPVRNQAKREIHLEAVLNDNNIINDYRVGFLSKADFNVTFVETNVAKLIIINPNSIQQGFIFQVCGNDLRILEDEYGQPVTLPCYSNLVRGISVQNYLLPNELELGSKSGFCKAKKDLKEFQYQLQPSILLFEYDEENTVRVHRFLVIKLDGQQDTESLLKVYQEPPQQIMVSKPITKQATPKPSTTESQLSLQPPPSVAPSQGFMPPTRIAQLTQQLIDFCQSALKQLDGQDDQSFFKPFFSMFTPQKFLDECSSRYLQIQNQRRIMIQQTRESSAVNQFCLLRKSFNVPTISLSYPQIETLLKQYSTFAEQFSWVCNFVIQTLKLTPIRRDRISFGTFNFPSISHIQVNSPKKQKTGRKITFDVEIDQQEKAPQLDKLSYIQKLCYAKKSKVKYFELKTEKTEVNDLNIQPIIMSSTSFGINSQRLLQPPQVDQVDEQLELESDDKVNLLQAKSEILSKQTYENKGLVRTKGGLLGQNSESSQLPSKNPFESEDRSKTNSLFGESKSEDNQLKFGSTGVFGNNKEKKQESIIFGQQLQTTNPFGNQVPKKESDKPAQQKPTGLQPDPQFRIISVNESRSLFATQTPPEEKPPSVPEQKPPSAPEQKPLITPEQKPPTGALFTGLFNQPVDKGKNNETAPQSSLFSQGLNQPPQQQPKQDGTALITSLLPGLNLGSSNQEPANQVTKNITKPESGSLFTQDSKETKPPATAPVIAQASLFSSVQQNNLFTSPPTQSTNTFLGIQQDASQTPKKKDETQKLEIAPPEKQTAPPQSLFLNQPKPDQPDSKPTVLTSQPLEPSQVFGSSQQIFGSSQPLQFSNFNTSQGASIFQSNNTQFTGMQSIGIAQPKPGTLNINAASFGTSSSIFDQPSQQATTQQRINFSGLQGQSQTTQLPNSIGGLLGQTGAQGSFLQPTTNLNLGFDPAAERPRK